MKPLLAIALLTLPLAAQRYSAKNEGGLIHLADGDALRAAISPAHGADLCSVEAKFHGQWRELLYRGCDYSPIEGWTGRAPWLWPAVGRNFPKDTPPTDAALNSSYDYMGKRYPMPIHGFARDMAWKVESVKSDASGARAVLSLADNAKTRTMYPFGWRLELEYLVAGGELTAQLHVRASEQNTSEMFFSAGNHITFRLPLIEGEDPTKTTLQSPSSIEYEKNGFMPTGAKQKLSYAQPAPLATMPVGRAVTLGGYGEGIWTTLTSPSGLAITLQHTPSAVPAEACLFNMWGDAANGFYSTEPWVGLQNSLVSGEGLVKLKPGGEWTWRLKLSYMDVGARRPREIPAR